MKYGIELYELIKAIVTNNGSSMTLSEIISQLNLDSTPTIQKRVRYQLNSLCRLSLITRTEQKTKRKTNIYFYSKINTADGEEIINEAIYGRV